MAGRHLLRPWSLKTMAGEFCPSPLLAMPFPGETQAAVTCSEEFLEPGYE